jgi:hypothetical protein
MCGTRRVMPRCAQFQMVNRISESDTFGHILLIRTRDSDIVEEGREQHSSRTMLRAELSELDPKEFSIYDAATPGL